MAIAGIDIVRGLKSMRTRREEIGMEKTKRFDQGKVEEILENVDAVMTKQEGGNNCGQQLGGTQTFGEKVAQWQPYPLPW